MNTNTAKDELEYRAVEALRALLGQISAIKLKEIRRTPEGMLASVDVLGHTHTLACEVKQNARPEGLIDTLEELHNDAAHCDGAATPVLIAPYLSPEAQALCKQRSASYLDLEGNARLALGEVFIGKRSQPARAASHKSGPAGAPHLLLPFPATHVPAPPNRRATA